MYGFDAKKWEKTRAMGRDRFILFHGVLAWGMPMAILFGLRQSYDQGWDTLWVDLIVALLLFPFAGLFFGLGLWKLSERRYAKTLSRELSDN